MKTINNLSSSDSLSLGDLLAFWSSNNGDTRKISMNTLVEFIKAQGRDGNISTTSTITGLKDIDPNTNTSNYIVLGGTILGDGLGGIYHYDSTSTLTEDDFLVVGSDVVGVTGRWLRIDINNILVVNTVTDMNNLNVDVLGATKTVFVKENGRFYTYGTDWQSKSVITIKTVSELSSYSGKTGDVIIVSDLDRGGSFKWESTGVPDGGIVFAGSVGYWKRQHTESAFKLSWFGLPNQISSLSSYVGTDGDLVQLDDGVRGGLFKYDSSATEDNGIVFGKLVRQYTGNIKAAWFGTIGNGTWDDTISINKAIQAAKGKLVELDEGIFRITSPIDSNGYEIRLKGVTPYYETHGLISDTYSSVYTEDIPSRVSGATIIKCDGTNFIGYVDNTSCNREQNLKLLENMIVWGLNGAKQGVHYQPQDTVIRNSCFALFEEFGILQRAGITSRIENCGFVDNGWNMAASGTVGYPNTYTSGCAIKMVSNIDPLDYTTVGPTTRVTTTSLDNIYTWDRNYTVNNKSGLRALQAAGALGLEINALGSYVGAFFDTCNVNIDGYYFENYTSGGFASGDGYPYSMYFINSQPNIGQGHIQIAGAGLTARQEPIKIVTTEPSWLSTPYTGVNNQKGIDKSTGGKYSRMTKEITIGTPGTTESYYFKNVIKTASVGSTVDDRGFLGMIPISVTRKANLANQSKGVWLMGRNRLSSDLPVTQLVFADAGVGSYAVTVTPSFSGNDLKIDILWGSSWGAGDTWILDTGMFGVDIFAS